MPRSLLPPEGLIELICCSTRSLVVLNSPDSNAQPDLRVMGLEELSIISHKNQWGMGVRLRNTKLGFPSVWLSRSGEGFRHVLSTQAYLRVLMQLVEIWWLLEILNSDIQVFCTLHSTWLATTFNKYVMNEVCWFVTTKWWWFQLLDCRAPSFRIWQPF